MKDEDYMRSALALAEKGCGHVNPNPMVGAVIVKNGKIIAEGWHKEYGGPHAERNALACCKGQAEEAVLYVTLEPCVHHGKTPPCTEAIIKSGIRRVVVGTRDPNPLVGGKGVEMLRAHNIEVTENVLKEECERLNEVFFHYIRYKIPYVVMKYAMTMDGKTAAASGQSKWITGEEARNRVQEDRNRYMGIMIGIETLLMDDPMLTCHLPEGRNPIRIVCDTRLRTPLTSNIVKTAFGIPTIIATACKDKKRQMTYAENGCEIMLLPEKENHLDIEILIRELGRKGIDSILLEGGGTLNWSALECGMVKRIQAYVAPKLFGGEKTKSPIGGCGVAEPKQGYILTPPAVTVLGNDILLESEVVSCSRESWKNSEE